MTATRRVTTAAQLERVGVDHGVVLELAGKWRHGYIPLDAVAMAIKAKQMKGDGKRRPGTHGKSRLDPAAAAQAHSDAAGTRDKGLNARDAAVENARRVREMFAQQAKAKEPARTDATPAGRKPSKLHEEYRRLRAEQDARFEASRNGGVAGRKGKKGGHTEEEQAYFGEGENMGRGGTEERLTFRRFLEGRRQSEDEKAHQAAYDAGVKLGARHAMRGTQPSDSEYDAAVNSHQEPHRDSFDGGFGDGVIAGGKKRADLVAKRQTADQARKADPTRMKAGEIKAELDAGPSTERRAQLAAEVQRRQEARTAGSPRRGLNNYRPADVPTPDTTVAAQRRRAAVKAMSDDELKAAAAKHTNPQTQRFIADEQRDRAAEGSDALSRATEFRAKLARKAASSKANAIAQGVREPDAGSAERLTDNQRRFPVGAQVTYKIGGRGAHKGTVVGHTDAGVKIKLADGGEAVRDGGSLTVSRGPKGETPEQTAKRIGMEFVKPTVKGHALVGDGATVDRVPEKAGMNAADQKLRAMTAADHGEQIPATVSEPVLRDLAAGQGKYAKAARAELDRRASTSDAAPKSEARRFGEAANSGQSANVQQAQAAERAAAAKKVKPVQGEMFGAAGEHQADLFDAGTADELARGVSSISSSSQGRRTAAARATVRGNDILAPNGDKIGELQPLGGKPGFGAKSWSAQHAESDRPHAGGVFSTKSEAVGAIVLQHEARHGALESSADTLSRVSSDRLRDVIASPRTSERAKAAARQILQQRGERL